MIIFNQEIPIFFQDMNISEDSFSELIGTILQEFDFDVDLMKEEMEDNMDTIISFVRNVIYSFNEDYEHITDQEIEELLYFITRISNEYIEEISENY